MRDLVALLVVLAGLSACCFVRAWTLHQWPFQRWTTYRVTIHLAEAPDFLRLTQSWNNYVTAPQTFPRCFIVTIPDGQIGSHLPEIGSWFGEGYVAAWDIQPI